MICAVYFIPPKNQSYLYIVKVYVDQEDFILDIPTYILQSLCCCGNLELEFRQTMGVRTSSSNPQEMFLSAERHSTCDLLIACGTATLLRLGHRDFRKAYLDTYTHIYIHAIQFLTILILVCAIVCTRHNSHFSFMICW